MRRPYARIALLWVAVCGVLAAERPLGETMDNAETQSSGLGDSVWQVEDIDERGIIDRSMITLAFTKDGRIAGNTGCNRYAGQAYVDGDVVTVSGVRSTRRACPPSLMDQERRFLDALGAASRYERDEVGRLLIYDGAGARRLLAVGIESDPTAERGGGSRPES